MPTLRINQHPGSAENHYRIEVSIEGIPGFQPQGLSTEIAFALAPQDRERIRWYFEDFLEFDQDPAPQIAKRVEELMAGVARSCSATSSRVRTTCARYGVRYVHASLTRGSRSTPGSPRRWRSPGS